MSDSFTGIYKGMVVDNDDPQFGYRVVCVIPQVLGDAHSNWAEPLQPTLYTPRINDVVWVQFADGDPSQPLYQSRVVITNSQISADAIDGMTITGATIQTAASGNRMVMHNDSAEGVINFYSGVSGEVAGKINPQVNGSGDYYIDFITSSLVDGIHDTPGHLQLWSEGSNGAPSLLMLGSTATFEVQNIFTDFLEVRQIDSNGPIDTSGDISGDSISGNTLSSNGKIFLGNPDTTTSAANIRRLTTQLALVTSLSKFKIDQEPLSLEAVRSLLDLTPKTWFDRTEVEKNDGSTEGLRRIPGVVAEDVEQHAPLFAEYDDNGALQGVAYDRIAAALIPIIRDQQRRIEELEYRLASLEAA